MLCVHPGQCSMYLKTVFIVVGYSRERIIHNFDLHVQQHVLSFCFFQNVFWELFL